MSFKLCAQMTNDGFHMHAVRFRDQIQDGRLAAILLLKRVHNHFSNIHGSILFKLGQSTAECIAGIVAFIRSNPRASRDVLNRALEKQVCIFAARVQAMG
uniref:Uncharacterized protein n=1 Tax=Eptatretus burgeri TaxID=7764 RepID=A0A8C4X054_EPTBU